MGTQLPKIIEQLVTKQDANHLIELFEIVRSKLYTINDLSVLSENLPVDIYESLQEYATTKNLPFGTSQNLEALFNQIEKEIRELPLLTLQIAESLSRKNIIEISQWISLNMGKKMLLSLEINRELIAGAGVGFQGYYKDYSYQEKLNEYLRKVKLRELMQSN